ncbi:MAG TPA: glycoside hydrolase family 3 N-terminal domain-containing protein, partial [Rhodomicrobium sp.]|nr:glycoside hydrolase family 3 N-terminal domain-containing protein [Rhodomicrobium sp.]
MTPNNELMEGLIESMSLYEKLGQLTMIRADFGDAGAELGVAKLAQIRAGLAGSILDLRGLKNLEDGQRAAVEMSRLRIPLLFTLDVLHGYETIFPIPLGEAAAFDPCVWRQTARVAATEAAAEGIALTFAPMLDVARDPRWGRIAESPGEDPFVGARFAEAKVRGFQQSDLSQGATLAATAKHFAGYG